MRSIWSSLKRVIPTRRTPWAHTARGAFRTRRIMSIVCAALLLTAGAGATAYAKIDGRLKLTGSSKPAPVPSASSNKTSTPAAAAKPTESATLTASASPSATASAKASATASATKTAQASTKSTSSQSAQSSDSSMTVSDPLEGDPFSGVAQVGTLFGTSDGSLTSHHCTGSVVSSPAGDIVVTAAHCVYGSSGAETDLAFVPDYDNGSMPYGVWDVSAVYVAPQWVSDRNPDYDVAFIVVHDTSVSSTIQGVVGADTLAVDQPFTDLTTVIGYPSDTNEPITCTNYTSEFSSTQLQFDCDGYPGGTSGSPFLTDVSSSTGLGSVDGVIGGYETGGDGPNVSYSVRFTDWVSGLLATAEAGS
jgi:guanyl-specific ribonuclease Sa